MGDRQCALNHDATELAAIVSGVINRFFCGRVGLAMASQCTKYEVSMFTRYEAVRNAENGVV